LARPTQRDGGVPAANRGIGAFGLDFDAEFSSRGLVAALAKERLDDRLPPLGRDGRSRRFASSAFRGRTRRDWGAPIDPRLEVRLADLFILPEA